MKTMPREMLGLLESVSIEADRHRNPRCPRCERDAIPGYLIHYEGEYAELSFVGVCPDDKLVWRTGRLKSNIKSSTVCEHELWLTLRIEGLEHAADYMRVYEAMWPLSGGVRVH